MEENTAAPKKLTNRSSSCRSGRCRDSLRVRDRNVDGDRGNDADPHDLVARRRIELHRVDRMDYRIFCMSILNVMSTKNSKNSQMTPIVMEKQKATMARKGEWERARM